MTSKIINDFYSVQLPKWFCCTKCVHKNETMMQYVKGTVFCFPVVLLAERSCN